MRLFGVLRERAEKEDLRARQEKALAPPKPREIFTGPAIVNAISLSPGERYVVFITFTQSEKGKKVIMPEYVTESGFTETKQIRKKVGYPEGDMRLGIYDLSRDTVYYASLDSLPGIHEFPLFGEKQTWVKRPGESRTVYISSPIWAGTGDNAVVNIKSADNKDRWIALLDPVNGELKTLDRQHDEAWIEGPGLGEDTDPGTLGWLPDSRTIYFQSEETGYSHLYLLDTSSGKKTQLTSGTYEIYDPFLSADGSTFYFTSNEIDPGQRQFYRMPSSGGRQTRLTTMTGNNSVSLSPDEKYMIILYSFANKPWELYFKKTGLRERCGEDHPFHHGCLQGL